MNLIWHIVKKDLRRFWLLIALLTLALYAKAEFLAIASDMHTAQNLINDAKYLKHPVALNSATTLVLITDLDLASRTKTIMLGFFCASDFILLVMLVMGAFLDDPALGDRSFWRTRPIAGWRMLAAKAVFIFLIGWPLQAAAQVLVNLDRGSSAPHWYSALGALAFIQAAWISVMVLASVLWRNPLIGVGALLAYCLFFYLLAAVLMYFAFNPYASAQAYAAAACLVLWATTLVVAWWMYHHRQRRLGFLLFALGLAVFTGLLLQ